MTQEQKRAIKRICKDYDFENIKDLWAKDENGLYDEICYYLNLK